MLVLVLLVVAASFVALRSHGVRRAILVRTGDALRDATALEITARDFHVGSRGRRITIDDIAVAMADAGDRPFLRVERLVAVLEPRTLWRRPLRIVSLHARGASLDLGAPLPAAGADEDPNATPAPLPFEIARFTITDSAIAGPPPAESGVAARAGAWTLDRLAGTGSLTGGVVDLAVERGELTLPGQPPALGVVADLEVRVSGELSGPFTIGDLRLVGDGITLEGNGILGLDASDPRSVAFTLDAEPGRLFVEGGSSRLAASANLDLRTLAGTLELEASAVPAELLEPFLGAELMAQLGAAGTLLEGDADLRLDGRDRVSGTGHLVWREGEGDRSTTLLALDAATVGAGTPAGAATTPPSAAAGGGIVVDLDATLLPSLTGRRVATARLHLKAWDRLAELEIVAARAALETADAARTLREVEARFPGLLPPLPGEFPIEGPLSISVRARGPVLDPSIDLDGAWHPQPAATVTLAARGRPVDRAENPRRMAARVDVAGLDLSAIAPLRDLVAGGSVSAHAEIEITGDDLDGRVAASGRHLELASGGRVDTLEVVLSGTPRAIDIVRLDATTEGAQLAATGHATLDPASQRPVRAMTLDVVLDRPLEGIGRVVASLALAEGHLRAEIADTVTDYGAVTGTLDIPLRALAEIPALAEAIEAIAAVAELPVAAAPGPIEIALRAPGLDGAGLLRRLGLDASQTLTGDVALDASLDLKRPAAGTAVLTVGDLVATGRLVTTAEGDGTDAEGATDEPRLARLAALDTLTLRLGDGRLTLVPLAVSVGGERLEIGGDVALSTGWKIGDPVADLAGPLRVRVTSESLDGATLLTALGVDPPFPSLRLEGASLRIAVDPNDPAAADGALEVRSIDAALAEDHRVRLREPLAVLLRDRRLFVAPTGIEIDGQVMTLAAEARLDPDWRPGRPPAELLTALDATIEGVLEADALNPYLAGAAASGRLALDAAVTGRLDALTGHARLSPADGGAEIFLYDPYFTRLRDPRVDLRIADGTITIQSATAELNQGELRLTGGADLGDGTVDVSATLDGVRYRLDYGLVTVADGELRLTRSASGRMRLEGRIVLDRGVLRRDLDPDREILRFLFAPEPIRAPGALDDLELDIELATVDGVRIRNNLADLRATWAPLTIEGTLAAPRIDGAIDLDPGGYLFAYGQTVRVDSGRLELRGDGSPPEIDLETTTSIEDPSVARAARGRGFVDMLRDPGRSGADEGQDLEAAISGGVADYYGERLANRLSEGLGALDVSLRPILVFGLDNPGTDLTVSRNLSAYVTAAVSVSLRDEGRQTYVAEVHDVQALQRFLGQLYTLHERGDTASGDSGSSEGVVIQQRLVFGRGVPRDEATGPRLRRVVLEPAGVLSRRAVRKLLDYERGQPLEESAAFESEVEVAELLRRRGFPGARVTAELLPVDDERADLAIAIDPGPRVEIVFRGTELHPRQKRMIGSIYRPDFYEPLALEEMREQTVRELRGGGYPDPTVVVTVVRAGADASELATATDSPGTRAGSPAADRPVADRTVIVLATGGERVSFAEPRIEGVDADAAAAIASRFPSAVLRAELAMGEVGADRRLRAAASEQGYPGAAVVARGLEPVAEAGAAASHPAERRPVVVLEPTGPRHRIVDVRITGLDDAEASAVVSLARAVAGDAVRSDLVTRGTLAIEDALQDRGHTRARVRARLLPSPGAEHERILEYEVDRAGVYRIGDVTLDGLVSTREDWASDVAGLPPGAPLGPSSVRAARRRLFETGLFDSVLPEIDFGPQGSAVVTFSVEERPRFEVAYGLLWQSDEGASAVVDTVDHNALGRGITLGARARYRDDDRSARLYGLLPRVLGTRASIETFAEYREERDDDPAINFGTDTFELDLHAVLPVQPRLVARVYGRYRKVEVFELEPDPFFPLPPQTIAWPSAGMQLVWDRRDDPVATARGTFASADLSGADETVGSDFSYARLFTRTSHHLPFGSFQGRPFLWAQSARVGLARAFRGQSLVGFELLFAGGEYSIRGYDDDSIGPGIFDDVEEQALGVVNQELRVPVWGDLLTGVIFLDAGQVWDDFHDFGRDVLTSGGLGLRAHTPVGVLRLDVAYPFDRRPGDDEVTVYFGLGNVF